MFTFQIPHEFNIHEPKVHECLYDSLVFLIAAFDKLDDSSSKLGSVLVFLPGILEIERAFNVLYETNL